MFSENVAQRVIEMEQVMVEDVAERVRVSISTVSRVLNGKSKEYMRPETEEWVLQVIREVDYSPNRNAPILKNERTNVIGCSLRVSPTPSSLNCSAGWRTLPIVIIILSLPGGEVVL